MNEHRKINRYKKGFTVAEILIAVVLGSTILVVLVAIYSSTNRITMKISKYFDKTRLPNEVLQKISEDLDTIIAENNVKVIVEGGKFDGDFPTSKLDIQKFITDANNNPKLYERIVWQANYDLNANAYGLVLYRGHQGMNVEDKLLDSKRLEEESQYPFIPVCEGLTLFKVQVIDGNSEEPVDTWAGDKLPKAVIVTVSFEQPFKLNTGEVDVNDADKFRRIITIDKTQKIGFKTPAISEVNEPNDNEPNEISDPNEGKKKPKEPEDANKTG
jgi:hypothetical protein